MSDHRKPLPLPPAAENDDRAIEMVRAWIAGQGLHCVLNVGHWHKSSDVDERRGWGILLADMSRHISNALEAVTGMDRRESLRMIAEAFNTEIASPTSEHTGEWPGSDDPVRDFWGDT